MTLVPIHLHDLPAIGLGILVLLVVAFGAGWVAGERTARARASYLIPLDPRRKRR